MVLKERKRGVRAVGPAEEPGAGADFSPPENQRRAARIQQPLALLLCFGCLAGSGCGGKPADPEQHISAEVPMTIHLKSSAFAAGQRIPTRYSGDGQDVSPPLSWDSVPDETRELVLVCDDSDAPSPQPWVHWVIYGIPAEAAGLPEGIPPSGDLPLRAQQGRNSWSSGQTIGYRGPAPPVGHGTHHYHFRLYALDERLQLPDGVDRTSLVSAMSGHVLAEGELIGTYSR